MTQRIAIWRISDEPVRVETSRLPLESKLESAIDKDPSILAGQYLIIGRQVPTAFGGFVDLLAIDEEGGLHVFELKRDRTPRDVVAQTLDYGSWAQTLSYEEVRLVFATYRPTETMEAAFEKRFGLPLPDELGDQVTLSIVAGSMDVSTERIVTYLSERFSVPINVLFFDYFKDGADEYLVRTWLLEEPEAQGGSKTVKARATQASWNGRDWYVSFGENDGGTGRRWSDALRYGFVSAGGGEWYSRTLRSLPEGARVFVYVPGKGYVGIGSVTRTALPSNDAVVLDEGVERRLRDIQLDGQYGFELVPGVDSDDREYVVGIEWSETVPLTEAFRTPGLFSNQNSACKLRNQFTIDEVSRHFGVE